MLDTQDRFDRFYAREGLAFGGKSSRDLRRGLKPVSNGYRALDLGAGDGRNTTLLESLGYHVTAVDVSRVGLDKIPRRATRRAAGNIQTVHDDVRRLPLLPRRFDLVVAVTLFDHLEASDMTLALERITQTISPGGVIYFKVHTVDDPGFRGNGTASELSDMIRHYFRRGELKARLKKNFDVLSYLETRELDLSHGHPHEHAFATAWAQRKRRMT